MSNTKETFTIRKLNDDIDELLQITNSLASAHPLPKEKTSYFLRIIEGIYRKATFTVLAIRHLSDTPVLADSAATLYRKLIDDVVTVEYMLMKGKEDMAKRFQEFELIQQYIEIKMLRNMGYKASVSDADYSRLEEEVSKIKQSHIHHKSGSFNHSWSGFSTEQMWIEIAKSKIFKKHEIKFINLTYLYGSWKTHTNPVDVRTYMTNSIRKKELNKILFQTLLLSLLCHVRLTTRYIDEISSLTGKNEHVDVAEKIQQMYKRWDSN